MIGAARGECDGRLGPWGSRGLNSGSRVTPWLGCSSFCSRRIDSRGSPSPHRWAKSGITELCSGPYSSAGRAQAAPPGTGHLPADARQAQPAPTAVSPVLGLAGGWGHYRPPGLVGRNLPQDRKGHPKHHPLRNGLILNHTSWRASRISATTRRCAGNGWCVRNRYSWQSSNAEVPCKRPKPITAPCWISCSPPQVTASPNPPLQQSHFHLQTWSPTGDHDPQFGNFWLGVSQSLVITEE